MTRDTLLGISLPVICAPMFHITDPNLVIAACRAGILGVVATNNCRSTEQLADWLDRIDQALALDREGGGRPANYAVNLSSAHRGTPRGDADLALCERRRIPLIITANGDPSDVIRVVHGYGGKLFHDAITMRHAEKAAEAGVDGLNLIAAGAGGHGGVLNPFIFVPAVRRFFGGTIVLGGGMSTGQQIFAAQALGADLVYMGTRFIASRESQAAEDYKAMIVDQRASDIVYTGVFGRHGWPANLMKASIRESGFDPDRLPKRPKPDEPQFDVRMWIDVKAAGQGVELIDDVPSVAEIVERLRAEYAAAGARPA